MKLINSVKAQRANDQRSLMYSNLIRREARIGGSLFGPIPENGRREFFCLDEHTWIWHEEWLDKTGQRHSVTTRYEVRPGGILKSQNGHNYRYIDKPEARNFYQAAKLYYQRVTENIYSPAAV